MCRNTIFTRAIYKHIHNAVVQSSSLTYVKLTRWARETQAAELLTPHATAGLCKSSEDCDKAAWRLRESSVSLVSNASFTVSPRIPEAKQEQCRRRGAGGGGWDRALALRP